MPKIKLSPKKKQVGNHKWTESVILIFMRGAPLHICNFVILSVFCFLCDYLFKLKKKYFQKLYFMKSLRHKDNFFPAPVDDVCPWSSKSDVMCATISNFRDFANIFMAFFAHKLQILVSLGFLKRFVEKIYFKTIT